MVQALRDGTEVEDPRLDRLLEFDEDSRNFPICAALPSASAQIVRTKRWYPPAGTRALDQGSEGACVGMGVTNDLRFYPVAIRGLDATYAREQIYWVAQKNDRFAGGAYPGAKPFSEGTSVLAGIKTAVDLGYYGAYHWAFSEPEMALGVSNLGPAIIGVPWYQGMYRPNALGYITPTGALRGGHCVLVTGISAHYGFYTIYNSWGDDWGAGGYARISRKDMAKLLAERGECAIITERLSGNTR